MTDQPHPPPALPAFSPVPRKADRSNGWKPHIQRAFIEALADTGSVTAACRMVRRSTHGAYLLRRQPGAEEFAAAWEAALDLGIRRIEDTAMDRALNGVEVPVYSYGKLVGSRTCYNDRLLMFMLRNRAPERFAEGRAKGLNAIGAMETERLKKKWRAEWVAEEKAKTPSPAEISDFMEKRVDELRRTIAERERRDSPHVKRLREELEEAVAADRAAGYDCTRDPEHELYEPALAPGWSRQNFSNARDKAEPSGEPDAEGDTEGQNPVWRSIKDERWE